jgi:hypothetical protein
MILPATPRSPLILLIAQELHCPFLFLDIAIQIVFSSELLFQLGSSS